MNKILDSKEGYKLYFIPLVAQGCGISIFQRAFADRDERVVEIPLGVDMPTLPVWLTASPAARRTPRIRAVWDVLARELPKHFETTVALT